jgi:hypothetical protein
MALNVMAFQAVSMEQKKIDEGLKCNEVIDMIYEQCHEEGNIKINTMKGRTTTLYYENGVCVIK